MPPYLSTIPIVLFQFYLLFTFYKNVSHIKPGFLFVLKQGGGTFSEDWHLGSAIIEEERELYKFLRPYFNRRIEVARSDVYERTSAAIFQNEERARASMNGVLIAGLLGTISMISMRCFPHIYAALTNHVAGEITLGTEMLNFIPYAFIPSAVGLFLSLFASLHLSNRLSEACREADTVTDSIMAKLPSRASVEDAVKEVFSTELKEFLRDLPWQMKSAFTDIREEMQHFLKTLVSPYAESMQQATEQVPRMSFIVQEFGKQLETFSTRLDALVQHTVENQQNLTTLSTEVTGASQELRKSVESASRLFGQFEERYKDFSDTYHSSILGTTERFREILNKIEESHTAMITRITDGANENYVKWLKTLNELEDKRQESTEEKYQGIVEAASSLLANLREEHIKSSELYQATIVSTAGSMNNVIHEMNGSLTEMIGKINNDASSNYVHWLDELRRIEEAHERKSGDHFLAMTRELMAHIESYTHKMFVGHKEELDKLKDSFRQISGDFHGTLDQAQRLKVGMETVANKASDISVFLEEVVDKTRTLSETFTNFKELHGVVNNLYDVTTMSHEFMKKQDSHSQRLVQDVYDALNNICRTMEPAQCVYPHVDTET